MDDSSFQSQSAYIWQREGALWCALPVCAYEKRHGLFWTNERFGPSVQLWGPTLPYIGPISIHRGIERLGRDGPGKVGYSSRWGTYRRYWQVCPGVCTCHCLWRWSFFFHRYNVLQELCEEVLCTQSTTVFYKKTINDSNVTTLGTVKVFEFEEVVGSVVCFLKYTNAEQDHITLKNCFLQNFCGLPWLNCTRNAGCVFYHMIAREYG